MKPRKQGNGYLTCRTAHAQIYRTECTNQCAKQKHNKGNKRYHSSAAANLLAGFFPLEPFPPLVDDPDVVLVLAPRLDVEVVRVAVRDFALLVPPSELGHASH